MSAQGSREEAKRLASEFEKHILDGPDAEKAARKSLRNLLTVRLTTPPKGPTIADAVEALADECGPQHALEAACLIRALGADSLLSPTTEHAIERPTVAIVQKALPSLSNLCNLSQRAQTFEKFERTRAVHGRAVDLLSPFCSLQPDLDTIVSARQMITQTLNDPLIKGYCTPFRLGEIRAGFELIQNKISRLAKQPTSLPTELLECQAAVKEQIAYCDQHVSFLTAEFFRPFLQSTDEALAAFLVKVRGRF